MENNINYLYVLILGFFRTPSMDMFRIIRYLSKLKRGRADLEYPPKLSGLKSRIMLAVFMVGWESPLRIALFMLSVFVFVPYFILVRIFN